MTEVQIIADFRDALRAADLATDEAIIADGKSHRYHVDDDRPGSKNGVYCLHLDGTPAGWFGTHKGGWLTQTWCAKSENELTAADREAHRKHVQAAQAARDKEAKRRRDDAARKARALWAKAKPAPAEHPYLTRKGVAAHDLRLATWKKWTLDEAGQWHERSSPGALLVPMFNPAGELRGLQAILAEEIDDRDKDFLSGAEKSGCSFQIGEPSPNAPLLVAEGFATGATLHETSGYPVAVAFDCGNLAPVALALRAKNRGAAIIICADNDRATEGNPGLTKANEAALAAGAAVAVPVFDDDEAGSDFNDLAALRGAEPVRTALARATEEARRMIPPPAPEPAADAAKPASVTDSQNGAAGPELRPRFTMDEGGLWLNEIDREGTPRRPRFIVDSFTVLSLVRDHAAAGWGLLLEIPDPDRRQHRVIIPHGSLKAEGTEALSVLLDRGFVPRSSMDKYLTEFLREARPDKRARITDRCGWHSGSFVLPDRSIGDDDEPVIFSSDAPGACPFKTKGSLEQWKAKVSALCVGNSRLLFAVSCAFAAPLLLPAGAEGGGFHYRGSSSDGKTTLLRLAASVAGPPEYMGRWRATSNGLEAFALQHSDCPSQLDELAQIDAKEAGDCAYLLSNGQAKARANRNGGARERGTWRMLFQSAGEIGLAEHMAEANRKTKAGQEVRLCEIPADAGANLGCFEELHEHGNGSDFAKALDYATRRHYGTAWIAYLEKLVEHFDELPGDLAEVSRRFEARCLSEAAEGQARRVAGRFALVAAGGEFATQWGITGWQPGTALAAATTCFQAWLANRGGAGNAEERSSLRQVREFLRRYGESAFADWDRPAVDTDTRAAVRSDRVGYRRALPGDDGLEYFVFVEVWRSRVCSGLDAGNVGRLLVERGYVERGTEKNRPHLVRVTIPGEGRARCVHILPSIWDDDDA
jgi:putative DNA primase/helicase